jgi:hypothetical protein
MFKFTKAEKILLLCAFDYSNISCENCLLNSKCGKSEEVYNLGIKLLEKLGLK